MAMTTDQMIEEIKGMTVLDLNTLVKALEEEFGVSAAAAVAVAADASARCCVRKFNAVAEQQHSQRRGG